MTSTELYEKFINFEKKHSLYSIKSDQNIYWWDIVRYYVYLKLYDHFIIKEDSTEMRPKGSSEYLKLIRRLFLDTLYLIKTVFKPNFQYMFFICSRYKDESGFNVDFATRDYLNLLKEKSFIIESCPDSRIKYNSYSNSYLLFFRIKNFWKKSQYLNFDINKNLNTEFETDIDFEKIIFDLIKKYQYEYSYYRRLLLAIRPKICFVNQNGLQKALFAAANELSMITVEVQHGQVNEFLMSYSYPVGCDYKHLYTLPNNFFTYSEFWNKINYPVKNKIAMGNSQFDLSSETNTQKNNTIAIIFADIYTNNLLNLTKKLAMNIVDDKIIVKLHSNQKHQIAYIEHELNQYKNVEIIVTERSMKDILSEVSSVVLIQSTVIYEALHENVKVFLYKKQDYDTHRDVFDSENVYLIDSEEEILEKYRMKFFEEKNMNFFDNFNKKRFLEFLDKRIGEYEK